MSYQPYPTSGYNQMPPQQRPEAPASIRNAVKLMYVGAGLSALSFIIGLATIGSLRQTVIRAANKHLTNSQIHTGEVVAVSAIVVFGIIGVGLWLWMAWANGRGRSWARIVAGVLFAFNTLGLLSVFTRAGAGGTKIFDVLAWLVGLGATIFLWRPESTQYYEQSKFR